MIPNSRGRIEGILSILEIAKNIEELDVPTYKLHPLKGGVEWLLVNARIKKLANNFPISQ